MNIFIHHDWRKKEGKYRQQTNKHWRDLTNLTKNNVQQYDNDIKKHLANTDIEIPQHALVTF